MAYMGYDHGDMDPLGGASKASSVAAYNNRSSTLETPAPRDMSSGAQPSYSRSLTSSVNPSMGGMGGPMAPTA